jgi:hypothetical protein
MSYFKPKRPERNVKLVFPFEVAFRTHRGEHAALKVAYCTACTLEYRTRRDIRGLLRYSFSNLADASGFAMAFGGEQITLATNGSTETRAEG